MTSCAGLSLKLQRLLLTAAVLGAAIYVAVGIADGDYAFAATLAGLAIVGTLHRLLRLPADVLVLGGVIFGYIVGNRGFAQQSLLQSAPLLPAEFALGLGMAWLFARAALERRLPVARDPLHLLLLLWIAVSAARLVYDLPRHRLLAIRDFATVYYAGFFFIVQAYDHEERVRSFLRQAMFAGVVVLPFVFLAFQAWPRLFLDTLVLRGAPLIFLKGDVSVTLIAAGVFLLQLDERLKERWWTHALALGLVLLVFASNSRAAQFALIVVDVVLLIRGSKVPWGHVGALVVAAALLVMVAFSGQSRWAEQRLHTTVERVLSMTDLSGTYRYESEELADKGDNNRFRLVWWRSVATETLTEGPMFGLGFGHDLASGFVREYDPNMGENFSARSPHNVIFTVLGRTGLVGCAIFFSWMFIVGRRTWQAFGAGAETSGHWCVVWVSFISGCLGVVLEGPMGALPFWVAMGLAYRPAVTEPHDT